MNSHRLLSLIHPSRARTSDSMGLLHRFSDSVLHTTLMLALVLLGALALYKIIDTITLTIWQLEPVVVTGQAKAPQPRR
ncbi:hypothetical protein [Roseateles violae]|uniref:Uncharacterized protein n=1 Tax=Roseateles violae TaxID=3058042 RepID=A0ABT8DUK2_9BURK|nr:hypothetical protein [Pelomonas sp. PFR6]MDN3921986.1 hypothetical protein [Pelomonas sp. PFR6]